VAKTPVKVTVNPTESVAQEAPADPNVAIDVRGRRLTIKQIDVLYESRLARIVGAEAASNTTYMLGYVFPAVSVSCIDGDEVMPPASQREIDALIQRLGREGISAVMQHLQAQVESTDEAAAIKN